MRVEASSTTGANADLVDRSTEAFASPSTGELTEATVAQLGSPSRSGDSPGFGDGASSGCGAWRGMPGEAQMVYTMHSYLLSLYFDCPLHAGLHCPDRHC